MSFPEPVPPRVPTEPSGNVFLRIFWMFGGLIAIALLAFVIAEQPPWHFSTVDAVFWIAVAAALGARVLDARSFSGLTADGRPTTGRDLRRYALGLVTISTLVWVAARSVQI